MVSKILVINRCSDCKNIGKNDDGMVCQVTDHNIPDPDKMPRWCPLPDDVDSSAGDV